MSSLLITFYIAEAARHERELSNIGRKKLDFAERGKCKTVLLRLSLAGNLVKPCTYVPLWFEWSVAMESGLSRSTIGLSCTQSKPFPLAHKHRPTSLLPPPASSAGTHRDSK